MSDGIFAYVREESGRVGIIDYIRENSYDVRGE